MIGVMIAAEDLMEGSHGADSFLGAREEGARSCGGGFLVEGLEDAACNRGQPYGEEPAESFSVNETLDKVPHQPKRARELARCSSCSSSSSRCHVVEVGQEGLGSSICPWAE